MTTVALKGLLLRKTRAILTAFSIVLGIGMVSGTYVLTDTIKQGFHTIFSQSYKNTSAVITARSVISTSDSGSALSSGFPAFVLPKVRALPGVAAAAGSIVDKAKMIDHNGKVISHGGAPNLAFSVDPKEQRFNPLTIVEGRWPAGPTQVAIDQATASKQHFKVGDPIGVLARGPQQQFTVSGIAKFADVASIGGATIAVFDLPTAQKLFDKVGKLDVIRVAAKNGVSTAQLIQEIKPILPRTAQVRDPDAQAQQDSQDVNGFLDFIQYFLLAFGFVALFVGAFVIFNTLSITVAQRTREFATLRTIGASRRQILRSVLLEALVIGVFASLIGLFLGLALAKGLNALFVSFGIDLPKSGTVFATRTVVVSMVLGTVITLFASIRPALRATRVPPIAAVREGAQLPPGRLARFGPWPALVVAAGSTALLVYGVFAANVGTSTRLLSLGVGVLGVFLGVSLLASRVVRPLAAALGWPATKIGGVAGQLARENTMRNPQRTAVTASALMIGLTLVTFVSVLGQGIRTAFEDAVNKQFVADYALTSTNGFDPFPPAASDSLRGNPVVTALSSVRVGDGRFQGSTTNVTGVDAQLSKVIDVNWVPPSNDSVPARLGSDGAFITKKYSDDHNLPLGSHVTLTSPTGKVLPLVIKGIFDPPKGGSPFGRVTISTQAFDSAFPQPANLFSFLNARGGVIPPNTEALKTALGQFPDAKIQTQEQFKTNQLQFLDVILNLLYVLLALSVIVSLFGIVNTLVLSVFERTREIGMLRAVGMTRRQVRRMIRHESIVTALIGAALGIALGLGLAALVTHALSDQGIVFAVNWRSLFFFVIAAIIAGVVAAIFPARRAARLNPLEALQYE